MKHASVDRSKRVDPGCRNHGWCPHCRRSRTMSQRRVAAEYGLRIREWADYTPPRDVWADGSL